MLLKATKNKTGLNERMDDFYSKLQEPGRPQIVGDDPTLGQRWEGLQGSRVNN